MTDLLYKKNIYITEAWERSEAKVRERKETDLNYRNWFMNLDIFLSTWCEHEYTHSISFQHNKYIIQCTCIIASESLVLLYEPTNVMNNFIWCFVLFFLHPCTTCSTHPSHFSSGLCNCNHIYLQLHTSFIINVWRRSSFSICGYW